MKVFTYGIALTMLSAAANASLFSDNEDNDLQEEWDDLDADRELQNTVDGFVIPADVVPRDSRSDSDDDERRGGGMRKRWNKRGNQGKKKGGKRGRKGRKGNRRNKGPFDVNKWEEKQENKAENMKNLVKRISTNGPKKCEKFAEKIADKFCETWAALEQDEFDEDKCRLHALAKVEKCKVGVECKISQKSSIFKCNSDFKRMMMSYRKPEVQTFDLNPKVVGGCYMDSLNSSKDCIAKAQTAFDKKMGEVEPVPEATIQKVREAMKAARQEKKESLRNKRSDRRSKRKSNRRSRRNNRRDRSRSGSDNDRRRNRRDRSRSDSDRE